MTSGGATESQGPSDAGLVRVGSTTDFPEGCAVPRTMGARRIVIYRHGGSPYALKDICPHMGDALHRLPPKEGAAVCIVGRGFLPSFDEARISAR